MVIDDQEIYIKFMQSVELLYLNEDETITNDAVSAPDLWKVLARYIGLTIQLDECYSGKGISVDTGVEAALPQMDCLCYSFDDQRGGYAVQWGGRDYFFDTTNSIPLQRFYLPKGSKKLESSEMLPDLVIHKKGADTDNIAAAEIKKNVDLSSPSDFENLMAAFIKLCCFTWNDGQHTSLYATGLYFGLHRDFCYVLVFKNGQMTVPCYRFEKKTGIWKKVQPQEVLTAGIAVV